MTWIGIRPATRRDASSLARVHTAAWRWAYRGHMPDEFLDSLSVKLRKRTWKTSLAEARDRTLVAEASGTVVGFISVGMMRAGPHEATPGHDSPAEPATAEVYAIYLLPDWVGKGIGKALMHAGESAMRALGASRAILWVLESNEDTHGFYEAGGWHRDGATTTYEVGGMQLPVIRYSRDL